MIRKTAALILALLLLLGTAQADGMTVRMTAKNSEVLSDGAMRALAQWLDRAQMHFVWQDGAQQISLLHGDQLLIQAANAENDAALTVGEWTTELTLKAFDPAETLRFVQSAAQKIGTLLSDYEKKATATAELGGVVKAKTQLSYTLSAEAWQEIWPGICDVLGKEMAAYTIESKGTLRRYFAADGSEIGAYFYAEKVRFAPDDVREVRLEYAYTPEKGLYLSFRCPNAAETRNLRISMTLKRSVRTDRTTYSVSCDVRCRMDGAQDTVLLEGSLREEKGHLSGKPTLNYTKKRDGVSVKHALALKIDLAADSFEGTVGFVFDRAGKTVLDGEILLQAKAADEMIVLPTVNAQADQLTDPLALMLLDSLGDAAQEDMFELLYYLNRPSYLTGEETSLFLLDDPEFIVTEVPEQ